MRKIDLAKQAVWSRANEKSRIEKGARYLPGGLMTPAAAAVSSRMRLFMGTPGWLGQTGGAPTPPYRNPAGGAKKRSPLIRPNKNRASPASRRRSNRCPPILQNEALLLFQRRTNKPSGWKAETEALRGLEIIASPDPAARREALRL